MNNIQFKDLVQSELARLENIVSSVQTRNPLTSVYPYSNTHRQAILLRRQRKNSWNFFGTLMRFALFL